MAYTAMDPAQYYLQQQNRGDEAMRNLMNVLMATQQFKAEQAWKEKSFEQENRRYDIQQQRADAYDEAVLAQGNRAEKPTAEEFKWGLFNNPETRDAYVEYERAQKTGQGGDQYVIPESDIAAVAASNNTTPDALLAGSPQYRAHALRVHARKGAARMRPGTAWEDPANVMRVDVYRKISEMNTELSRLMRETEDLRSKSAALMKSGFISTSGQWRSPEAKQLYDESKSDLDRKTSAMANVKSWLARGHDYLNKIQPGTGVDQTTGEGVRRYTSTPVTEFYNPLPRHKVGDTKDVDGATYVYDGVGWKRVA
jgi:hypothetical protein